MPIVVMKKLGFVDHYIVARNHIRSREGTAGLLLPPQKKATETLARLAKGTLAIQRGTGARPMAILPEG